jgi:hypothetical protein
MDPHCCYPVGYPARVPRYPKSRVNGGNVEAHSTVPLRRQNAPACFYSGGRVSNLLRVAQLLPCLVKYFDSSPDSCVSEGGFHFLLWPSLPPRVWYPQGVVTQLPEFQKNLLLSLRRSR